jgi:hypothetical protein
VKAPPDAERRPREGAAVQAPNMDPAKNRVKALAHERSTPGRLGEHLDGQTVRIVLPLASRCASGQHRLAVDYWGMEVACSCCGERRPTRWVDAWHGEYGHCQPCRLSRVPAWRAGRGARCEAHQRWDAEQARRAARGRAS